ncbi:MAG: hypothetical protein JWQ89_4049 [Devosia sp.]|uniref:hypothetical protein n=1 Tax=Devosia sp. TaxID=1871048 RepID=UPI00261D7F32|nr:hypothetical protein [Devosia sp.]MDB5542322.1 hypothetical protein [Devosia sp.]
MAKNHFEDPEEVSSFLFETVERRCGLHPDEHAWTFICFAMAGRSDAQCALILLDALLRGSDATGMFEYEELDGAGRFRSRKSFAKEFGFKVRIASKEYVGARLGWFLAEAGDGWEPLITNQALRSQPTA